MRITRIQKKPPVHEGRIIPGYGYGMTVCGVSYKKEDYQQECDDAPVTCRLCLKQLEKMAENPSYGKG